MFLRSPFRASAPHWGFVLLFVAVGLFQETPGRADPPPPGDANPAASGRDPSANLQKATFGSGCFWCTEAVFQRLKGVRSVTSGYSGGHVKNPSYRQVSTGLTGHAEVVQIAYDPAQITYAELLEVFWSMHDPTTWNRQGPDVGPQYRSVIFYHDEKQREQAEDFRKKLDASHVFRAPIVTQIVPFREFFPAENYHQEYYELHKRQPYCRSVIRPKIEKLQKVFGEKLKDEAPTRHPSRDSVEQVDKAGSSGRAAGP